MGIFGFLARRSITETLLFVAMLKHGDVAKVPIIKLLRHNLHSMLMAIALVAVVGTLVSFCLFLPSMIGQHLQHSHLTAYSFTTMAMVILALGSLCAGAVSDKVGRRRLILCGCVMMLLCAWPAWHFLLEGNFWLLLLATVLPASLINGCYQAAMTEMFDTSVRYSGLAISHNLGMSVFGGISPYLMELLSKQGFLSAPILLLSTTAVFAGLSALYMPCRFRMKLDQIKATPKQGA